MTTVLIIFILMMYLGKEHPQKKLVKQILLFAPIVSSVATISQNIAGNPKPISIELLIAGFFGVVLLSMFLYIPVLMLLKVEKRTRKSS